MIIKQQTIHYTNVVFLQFAYSLMRRVTVLLVVPAIGNSDAFLQSPRMDKWESMLYVYMLYVYMLYVYMLYAYMLYVYMLYVYMLYVYSMLYVYIGIIIDKIIFQYSCPSLCPRWLNKIYLFIHSFVM